MRPVVHRVNSTGADASEGGVTLAPVKAFWNGGLLFCAVAFAPATFGFDALLVFLITTYVTLLLGHSVGMHRRLIHKSFDCEKWLERILVYLGVLVGMAGHLEYFEFMTSGIGRKEKSIATTSLRIGAHFG